MDVDNRRELRKEISETWAKLDVLLEAYVKEVIKYGGTMGYKAGGVRRSLEILRQRFIDL